MKEALNRLAFPYITVTLLVEEKYKISYYSGISKRKVLIFWTLDGIHNDEYTDKNSEIGKMFGRPVYSQTSPKLYKLYKSMFGKKEADKLKQIAKTTPIFYSTYWKSPRTLISHLSRNYKKIEVLDNSDSLFF